jgi:hypothetical protein
MKNTINPTFSRREFIGSAAAAALMPSVTMAESAWKAEYLARGLEKPLKPLFRFDADGKFTFLHFSDLHLHANGRKLHEYSERVIRQAVSRAKPSLAVLTGDNIDYTRERAKAACERGRFREAVDPLIALFRELKLPFAVTFGNHDSEWSGPECASRREQYEYYRSEGGRFFVDHDVPTLRGAGSGVIGIARPDEDKPSFNLFVMDSGDYKSGRFLENGAIDTAGGYDACSAGQIEWYEKVSGKTPCLWFQHIIVPDANTNGLFVAAEKGVKLRLTEGGPEVIANVASGVVGALKEPTCPPQWNTYRDKNHCFEGRTLYESWCKMRNLKGAYFGHDHINSFDGTDSNGIRLGMTKCGTRWGYNDGDIGCRVFTVSADGNYTTRLLTESVLSVAKG